MFRKLFTSDLKYTSVNQLWKVLSGPLILLFVPLYLSESEQGLWFLFISLGALIILADMGFTTILLQFSAYEFAHLEFTQDKEVVGEVESINKLASLWRFSIRWALFFSFFLFPLIYISGRYFIEGDQVDVEWQLPWLLYCVASVLVFFNSILLSFVEGCDSVADVQWIRFIISFINVVILITLLVGNNGLYSLSISVALSGLFGLIYIFYRFRLFFYQMYKVSSKSFYPWGVKILPLLKRYAVSWISGYLIFYMFTPIAFHFYGASVAGKVGLTVAVCTAIFNVSNIWMTVITPKINMLISMGDRCQLNVLFKKHIFLSALTFIVSAVTLLLLLKSVEMFGVILDRLVPFWGFVIILSGWFFHIFINGIAIYTRAHKKEPLMLLSVFMAVYVITTTLIVVYFLPFDYFFSGFLTFYIFGLYWGYKLFKPYWEGGCNVG